MTNEALVEMAKEAMAYSYSPYSSCKVGAALLSKDGQVFTGCNIENAAFGPTVCAERTAVFKAVSEGVTEFEKIAVVGGRNGKLEREFPPCGVCRQVLTEFCGKDLVILLGSGEGYSVHTLGELLPLSFQKRDVR